LLKPHISFAQSTQKRRFIATFLFGAPEYTKFELQDLLRIVHCDNLSTDINISNYMRAYCYPSEKEDQLQSDRGYLSISLSNHTSASRERLREITEWTRTYLGAFDVIIGDYFHRHNLEDQQGLAGEEALKQATADGVTHTNRIRKILDSFGLFDTRIRLATSLYTQPQYHGRLEALEKLYLSNVSFKNFIEKGTDMFLERKSPTRLNVESARNHSKAYQLEELAIFELLSMEGYTTNIYPGAHLPVMKEIVSGDLQQVLPLLAKMILVELKFGN
jgi:tRNA-dependent cyclodipeptide synthase